MGMPYSVAAAPDGSIYVADYGNYRIRRVGPDGIITTVAGTGVRGHSGDGGPATEAQIYPVSVTIGQDCSIYISGGDRIRRIGHDGIITTVAGGGTGSDGDLATEAELIGPTDVAVGRDGSIYIAEHQRYRIRRITSNGIITTVAGSGMRGYSGDGGPATAANIDYPDSVAIGPDGSIYISVNGNRIRRISPSSVYTAIVTEATFIPSEDGKELFTFDYAGRHLRTLNALTNAVLYEFTYDANGLLTEIRDGDGNLTSINRDAGGNPTAIVAPGGQTTGLLVNADGYLQSITNPAGETASMAYDAGGLLTMYTNPRGNSSQFTYDDLGRLIRVEDPEGGVKTLARTEDDTGYTITKTTTLGRLTTYRMDRISTGDTLLVNRFPDESEIRLTERTDGTRETLLPDATSVTTDLKGPIPALEWSRL
jgi:YD repeat-containing protein